VQLLPDWEPRPETVHAVFPSHRGMLPSVRALIDFLAGNETAAHLRDTNRMTLMWCAFDGLPRILRVYGSAETIHPRDAQWAACAGLIPPPVGARQYFRVHVDLVQTSCGYAVPLMDFVEDRQVLTQWAEKRGSEGVRDYWSEKNRISLDGLPTGIAD
jgi:hypothetical protein